MAAGDEAGEDFVTRAGRLFATEIFKPMLEQASAAPDDVRRLIADLRMKLDALDVVVAACSAAAPPPGPAGRAVASSAAAASGGSSAAYPDDDDDAGGDLGRNQRSKLRELAMLEELSRDARPFALQQLMTALAARRFDDTSGAIVSQLHRLKKLGLIDQPTNGMYVITDAGLGHVRRLKSSLAGLVDRR